jgi:hypothetical protein
MKKSIKNLEAKAVKNVKVVMGGADINKSSLYDASTKELLGLQSAS